MVLKGLLKILGIAQQTEVAPKGDSIKKRRVILLPRSLSLKLNNLTSMEDEMNGVLIYKSQEKRHEKYCPVLHLYLTAMGTPNHVQADPQRMEVANELFQNHPEYGYVKFHTHSKGTIAKFGEYFATNFSSGDVESYEEQITHDPDFIGMVVTPSTKILYGKDNPILREIDQDVPIIGARINEELRAIAKRKGYNFESFQSRM